MAVDLSQRTVALVMNLFKCYHPTARQFGDQSLTIWWPPYLVLEQQENKGFHKIHQVQQTSSNTETSSTFSTSYQPAGCTQSEQKRKIRKTHFFTLVWSIVSVCVNYKNTIRDGGSSALKTAEIVDTVDIAYTVDIVYTVGAEEDEADKGAEGTGWIPLRLTQLQEHLRPAVLISCPTT